MTDIIDILSILDPDTEEATRRPIDDDKLKDVFVKLQDVINNELVSVDSTLLTGDDTFNEIRLQNANGDLIGRIRYQENKSFGQTQVTGIFLQENTGSNDSPVWADRYAFDVQSSGALHLNINGSAIVFPDGSTISSDHFNSSGEVNRYKGNDIDGDGDGSVNQADNSSNLENNSLSQVRNHTPNSHGQSEHDSGSVGRSELKTSTGSSSGNNNFNFTVNLNAYAFFPDTESGPEFVKFQMNTNNPMETASPNNVDVEFNAENQVDWNIAWRYVQSSPPYNLGDGQVGVFAYLSLENGDIQSVWLSEDPPWYGIGTTMIGEKPHYIENDGPCFSEVENGNLSINEWRQKRTCQSIPNEKDPHRYMERRPHPFPNSDNVVLIDPACDLSHELRRMHHEMIAVPDEPNLTEILREGYFEIKNDVTDQREASIPGVSIVEGAWK